LTTGSQICAAATTNLWAVFPPNPGANLFTPSLYIEVWTAASQGPFTVGFAGDPNAAFTPVFGTFTVTQVQSATPEPTSLILLSSGGVLIWTRRKKAVRRSLEPEGQL
jgi:hypothetical protein